jgi:UDP-N-acetylmuramate dehydrogenase
MGGAQIFPKHANIIIKGPACTAQDVYDLHMKMIEIVKTKFNLQLNREVRFVGPFKDQKHEGFW